MNKFVMHRPAAPAPAQAPASALSMKAVAHRRGRSLTQALIVAVIALLIIAATALTGIRRGMDHKVTYGPEQEQSFISIALSESVYGLDMGYVAFRSVHDKLVEIWNRGAKSNTDPILIASSSNADQMNAALQAAASLGPQTPGYISDHTLLTPLDDDLGEVDFYKMAFRLFGLKIQSCYYLFFALLALSSLVFIIAFADNPYALTALLATLFAFFIELHVNLFSPLMPTFPGQRHGSTLALVPLWYFIFSLGRRPSPVVVGGALVELAILILAWRIRGSVSWMFVFLFALMVARAARSWLREQREGRSWRHLPAGVARWPAFVLLLGVAANFVYNRVELNPVYFTDDVMPYHGAWHSAYLGLELDPEMLSPRARQALGQGDVLGYVGALDYADRIHFLAWTGSLNDPSRGYISPWTQNIKTGLHEDLMRGAVLEAISKAPLKAAVLYAWRKPIATLIVLKDVFLGARSLHWPWYLVAASICCAFMLLSAGGKFDRRAVADLVVISAAAAAFAALPNIWAYPAMHVIADLVLSLVIFAELALGAAMATVVAAWRKPGARQGHVG
jgi:hypothetical protein